MKNRLNHTLGYLRTTAIGGLLFLLPVAVVVVLLGYVFQAVAAIHEHLKEWIPFDKPTGIAVLFCLTILLLLASCFIAGLLARRAVGMHFSRTVESQLMKVYPKYGIFKDLLAGKIGGNENIPSLSPVLVRQDDNLILAFQADRLANGFLVIYFPGSPDTWDGSLAVVGPDKVQAIDLTFMEALRICERLGRDSSSLLSGAVAAMATQGNSSQK